MSSVLHKAIRFKSLLDELETSSRAFAIAPTEENAQHYAFSWYAVVKAREELVKEGKKYGG